VRQEGGGDLGVALLLAGLLVEGEHHEPLGVIVVRPDDPGSLVVYLRQFQLPNVSVISFNTLLSGKPCRD